MKSIYARLTFSEELLGTASGDPEVHESFIASKAPTLSVWPRKWSPLASMLW